MQLLPDFGWSCRRCETWKFLELPDFLECPGFLGQNWGHLKFDDHSPTRAFHGVFGWWPCCSSWFALCRSIGMVTSLQALWLPTLEILAVKLVRPFGNQLLPGLDTWESVEFSILRLEHLAVEFQQNHNGSTVYSEVLLWTQLQNKAWRVIQLLQRQQGDSAACKCPQLPLLSWNCCLFLPRFGVLCPIEDAWFLPHSTHCYCCH